MAEQFSTFKEDLENIGIHITDEQYSDLCEINLFMKGMPDIPVYNILLILKTLVSECFFQLAIVEDLIPVSLQT